MKNIRHIVVSLVWLLFLATIADACPTCKESVAENGGNLIRGYFWSIIFMMSMPFLILAGLSTMFYLDVRRARARQGKFKGVMPEANQDALPAGSV